ncbi:MAG TPA: hypothetical protein VGE29_11830 [Prosthecobacter sp.]
MLHSRSTPGIDLSQVMAETFAMRAFFHLGLALLFGSLLQAEEIPTTDTTIIPGVRVGPIEKGMTLFGLKTVYGGGTVKAADIEVGEGSTEPGAKLFAGTDRELEILFNPEGDEREVWDVRIIGKAWKFQNGLKLGQRLEEVEKINGKPFKVLGFGWDYGGYANFEGGKLEGKVSIRFGPTAKEVSDDLSGDKEILSTDKKLRAAKVVVETISISLRDGK